MLCFFTSALFLRDDVNVWGVHPADYFARQSQTQLLEYQISVKIYSIPKKLTLFRANSVIVASRKSTSKCAMKSFSSFLIGYLSIHCFSEKSDKLRKSTLNWAQVYGFLSIPLASKREGCGAGRRRRRLSACGPTCPPRARLACRRRCSLRRPPPLTDLEVDEERLKTLEPFLLPLLFDRE